MVSDRTDFSTDLVMKRLGNETPVIRKAAQLTNYRDRRKGHRGLRSLQWRRKCMACAAGSFGRYRRQIRANSHKQMVYQRLKGCLRRVSRVLMAYNN